VISSRDEQQKIPTGTISFCHSCTSGTVAPA
jgi:hypothetical protein